MINDKIRVKITKNMLICKLHFFPLSLPAGLFVCRGQPGRGRTAARSSEGVVWYSKPWGRTQARTSPTQRMWETACCHPAAVRRRQRHITSRHWVTERERTFLISVILVWWNNFSVNLFTFQCLIVYKESKQKSNSLRKLQQSHHHLRSPNRLLF